MGKTNDRRAFAERFAADWLGAWNRRDLEGVLAHYSDNFEMSSPLIAKVTGILPPVYRVKQRYAVTGSRLCEAELKMEAINTLVGVSSWVINYHGPAGLSPEFFFFNDKN